MKVSMAKVLALFAVLGLSAAVSQKGDRTITQVVNLLQGMLDKSKAEGEEEKVIYGKFKCYCDTNEAEKSESIKRLTDQIAVLESKIAEVQGDTGDLSSDVAQLKADMADNKAARSDATTLRDKENAAFKAEVADLTQAISQMKSAIKTLSDVGADQTASTGADNKQFMAKASLLSMQSEVQVALRAASALMTSKQRSVADSFLQAPFTGTYTSQSAVVLGILKNMRDTFEKNLADARTTEKTAQEVYDKFMADKKKAFDEMEDSYEEKQKALSTNDDTLSSDRKQLADAQKQKATDQEFLDQMLPMCAEKAKGYANRKLMRANEEAAIAQAISILNSDEAFETFGTTDATSTGSTGGKFIQLRAVRKHMTGATHSRQVLEKILKDASRSTNSARLSKVLASVSAENPFSTVLDEIKNMITLIDEEAASDKKNLDWCNSERDENEATLTKRKSQILALESKIDTLTKTIEDPKTGLKFQIEETELQLVQNTESQTSETKERTEDNLAYQADIKNLQSAAGILTKAIKVLKAYYDDLEKKLASGEALVQKDAPEAWKGDGAYEGQSKQGGDVITMLEFILKETTKEEMTAHADEEKSQADYEDSMTTLKKEEADAQKLLANLHETLAEKEKDLLEAKEDHKATVKDHDEVEAYLKQIKPGCDFITTNFDEREKNRGVEKDALNKAVRLIKATPAYTSAVNAATVESYGECKKPCVKDEDHVECKACMADVTIPAYCAGHEGTTGC